MNFYEISQLKVPLQYTDSLIFSRISKLARIEKSDINSFTLKSRSLDARHEPCYVLGLTFTTKRKIKLSKDVTLAKPVESLPPIRRLGLLPNRPVVVGAGPAGLAAAYTLAQAGTNPILIERGESCEQRKVSVEQFWNAGILNPESNVHFGEGGAGLFSDGKLTARSKEKAFVRSFLQLLVDHGASNEILIDKLPHVGSDALMRILPKIRESIIKLGGEIHFNTKLSDIHISNGKLTAITLESNSSQPKSITTDSLFLAIGHSARDTYQLLHAKSIALNLKTFAIGLRLELPQSLINNARYSNYDESYGAAEFRLTRKPEGNSRNCYTFCMCPGGQVVSCSNEEGFITSNGMSYQKRDLPNGNAAFIVPIHPEDLTSLSPENPLAGIDFQKEWESKAFNAGGGNYALPAQRLIDFLQNRLSTTIPEYHSPHRIKLANLTELLPDFVVTTLQTAIPKMLQELGVSDFSHVMLFGPEMRSSAPLQITRTPTLQSVNTEGLFVLGEGAGYAGGIVSSGVDGLKAAHLFLSSL